GEPERARPLRRRRPELVRLRGELEPVGDHEDAVAHLLLVEVVALAPQDLAEEIRERRMRVDERLTGVEEDRADRHARMIPAPIRRPAEQSSVVLDVAGAGPLLRRSFEVAPEPVDLSL